VGMSHRRSCRPAPAPSASAREPQAVRPATYEAEAALERGHWWFRGRRRLLGQFLAGLTLPADARVLDVGCGTGANGPVLAGAERFTVGLDASALPLGLGRTGERTHGARVRADAGRLPFAGGSFDLVTALDVLEHLDDDAAAARELHRVLRPGGALVVFVPALRLLWGLQDEVSHHRRRYGRQQLRAVVAGTGLQIERLTFFNTLLFPPILAARLVMRLRPPRILRSENELGGPVANRIAELIFSVEAPFLARANLPIGVSLACVARRREMAIDAHGVV
jgi:SAM-dependent methyltransferase